MLLAVGAGGRARRTRRRRVRGSGAARPSFDLARRLGHRCARREARPRAARARAPRARRALAAHGTSTLMRSGLPIDEALGPLAAALHTGGNAVVVAPPGAGKSTVV